LEGCGEFHPDLTVDRLDDAGRNKHGKGLRLKDISCKGLEQEMGFLSVFRGRFSRRGAGARRIWELLNGIERRCAFSMQARRRDCDGRR
jgi:hypothetical protein